VHCFCLSWFVFFLQVLMQIVLLVWAFRFRWSIHFRKWFLPEVGTVCAQPGGGVSPIAHCLWIRV
jgi:hypothetical protein